MKKKHCAVHHFVICSLTFIHFTVAEEKNGDQVFFCCKMRLATGHRCFQHDVQYVVSSIFASHLRSSRTVNTNVAIDRVKVIFAVNLIHSIVRRQV